MSERNKVGLSSLIFSFPDKITEKKELMSSKKSMKYINKSLSEKNIVSKENKYVLIINNISLIFD